MAQDIAQIHTVWRPRRFQAEAFLPDGEHRLSMSFVLTWLRPRWASWASERTRTELRLLAVILAIAFVLRFI